MASPSPSLPRQLLQYMTGALHRSSPIRMHPKPFAASVSIAVSTAAGFYFNKERGRHGDGINADGAAAAASAHGMEVAATRTPKEADKGKNGGDVHPPRPREAS
ncbi:unnamed protein product [Urochloa humidicola]